MLVKFDRYSSIITVVGTGVSFALKGKYPEDVQFEPVNSPSPDWSKAEMSKFREKAINAIESDLTREEMRRLINDHFYGDNFAVAAVISKRSSKKKVSARGIQSWLINPDKPSSRPCPPWALKILKEHVNSNPKMHERRQSPNHSWIREVESSKSVEFATNNILADKQKLEEWEKCSLSELPKKMFELEKRHEEHLWYLNGIISKLESAIRDSNNFEDMKKNLLPKLNESSAVEYIVRDTRKAIEDRKDEFSDEGDVKE